jgi:hypothetical protein
LRIGRLQRRKIRLRLSQISRRQIIAKVFEFLLKFLKLRLRGLQPLRCQQSASE